MDRVQYLLEEIQTMQCLVYLAHEEGEPTPVHELMEALHVSPGPCRACLGALTREGFVGTVPSATHPLPRAVRLTARGRAEVRKWQANAHTERLHARG